MRTVRDATLIMFKRYSTFEIKDISVINLINTGIEKINELPIDKLSRWLGFIQGYLIFNGLTTINKERDFSRPIFHQAYKNENILIPKSIDVQMKE